MEDEEEQIREDLSRSPLSIDITRGLFFFDNIDSFVALSRGNTCIKEVDLYPFDSHAGNYEFWDKVGQIVGELVELRTINIHFLPFTESDDDSDETAPMLHPSPSLHNDFGDESPSPDWEIFTRILPYLRRKVNLCLATEDCDVEAEKIQGFARAIHGHPMILEFRSDIEFSFANFGPWCSALVTLPSLERVSLGVVEPETEDQTINLEPFAELLRKPALRVVIFEEFHFTNALCYATANALEEGSSVTDISFSSECSFPDGGRAIIANALKTNATVTDVKFFGAFEEPFFNTLAVVLLCNSTLQNLTVYAAMRASGRWFSSIFLSLGMNTTLKSRTVYISDEYGDKLRAAMRSGLAKNSTLKELSLANMVASDDDGAVSARNTLSFLHTNSSLKSLTVSFAYSPKESYVSAFRLEAVKMLKNTFIETLVITGSVRGLTVEAFLALISALQLNTTLKTLGYQTSFYKRLTLTDDEVKQLVSILMKNYVLERLVPNISCPDDEIVKAILRLNKAGRRYLIEDGSSISKGVKVLSAVNDDTNCVFMHLLENPGLCDRRAVEATTTTIQQPDANLDESSSTGKRERAQSQPDQEPRRRLT
jgi:hypothetical protein